MIIESVFILKNTDLVFFGQLSETQTEDLETVLGQIVSKAKGQSVGTQKLIALKQGKFLYSIYSQFVIIIALSKGTEKEIADKLLKRLGDLFNSKFSSQLASFTGDNSLFTGFTTDIQEIIGSILNKDSSLGSNISSTSETIELPKISESPSSGPNTTETKEEIENVFGKDSESSDSSLTSEKTPLEAVPEDDMEDTSKTIRPTLSSSVTLSQRKGMIEFKKTEQIKDDFNSDKPLVTPQKRQAFPDGIPEYARDEILFNESFEVQKNFECELVNYSVSDIKITLNISLTHIYELEIDFTNYPELPKVIMSEGLIKELGKPLEEISYFLRNWDPKIPAHITELVYEMEKILTRFKSQGKLSQTQDMPGYVLPEIEPLKNDLKWDPNFKPKAIEPPAYIPPEQPASSSTPNTNDNAPSTPGSSPAKSSPGATPKDGKKVDPKEEKRRREEDEKKRKDLEKKQKEDEKKRKENEKIELEKKKELEKLKKQQAKDEKRASQANTEEKDDDI